MIPKECKRLAEVDFPIAVVSKHAVREKASPKGHPSMLHLWWARRPLASSRAILLGLLLPDPCDENCPEEFKKKARALLGRVQGMAKDTDLEIRKGLLKFIGDFANWDLSSNPDYIAVGRGLVKAAHGEEPPLVVDPFAGGGSIPLEALRLGCAAFATDLNPVACLILKVLLDDLPRHGPKLGAELRRAGAQIKGEAERELTSLYPEDPDGATPIAYIWARTVRCESPNCGAEIPLARSFWLCKKANRRVALKPTVARPKGQMPAVSFEIIEPETDDDVPKGTVSRAKATCVACRAVLAPERVRTQIAAQRGGGDTTFDENGCRSGGARLLAVVRIRPGGQGRQYRLANDRDYQAVRTAQERVAKLVTEWESVGKRGLCPIPDEPLPPIGTLGFRVQRYGMLQWGDLFTARQKVALAAFSRILARLPNSNLSRPLACAFSRVTMSDMSCTRWNAVAEKMQHTFGRQALPIVWDFAEVVPVADAPGNWRSGYEIVADIAERSISAWPGQVQEADATIHPLPSDSAAAWFTDPPYYDAVPYADLSDFFFVWLRRALHGEPLLSDPLDSSNSLTPKGREAVQDKTKRENGRAKDRSWFEETMARAFAEGRRVLGEDGIGSVVFAHKTTEGWEALLTGMVKGGWTITGSWPIATEMGTRLRARDSAALATSVHLICRPRRADAPVGDWARVLRELPGRVADWIRRLESEGVRGADLVFACIGPALKIYSHFSKVVDVEDREIPLGGDPQSTEPYKRGYLAYVWEAVGRAALEQILGTVDVPSENGMTGVLEEDARLTALFLWTLQSTNGVSPVVHDGADDTVGDTDEPEEDDEEEPVATRRPGFTLIYDVVRRFAQPLGIHLDEWNGRIIEQSKGFVRLLPVRERARQLFGEDGADALAGDLERDPAIAKQLNLFPAAETPPPVRGRGGRASASDEALLSRPREATTLDRVHVAMLLQAGGRTNALRVLLKAEQERGAEFQRLANALSALYPSEAEEKRVLDAMLLAFRR